MDDKNKSEAGAGGGQPPPRIPLECLLAEKIRKDFRV